MKKHFLLIPAAFAVLTACSNNTPAPISNADGTLQPGIMQPVNDVMSNSTSSGWEPQIQQQAMPDSMGGSAVNTPAIPAPVPVNTPTTFPPVAAQPAAPATVSNTAPCTNASQNFEIPRNAQTNAPDYSRIDKGFYKGSSYTVRKGDTMFLIAYISGMDVKELAALNNISEPYALNPGQTLRISNCSPAAATPTATAPAVTYTAAPNGTQYGSDGSVTGPIKAAAGTIPPAPTATNTTPVAPAVPATVSATTPTATPITNTQDTAKIASNVAWRWPTEGKIIQHFSNADGGNKGIDIGGKKGQAVKAAAAGRVVYAGNALRGYGNLIIIKHNDDFLSAYAHNDSILVKDQQEVKSGQQIAKMGNSGTDSVKLHFEIRYQGKSVNPISYLPAR